MKGLKNLIYKELTLVVSMVTYIMLATTALLLIPAYPYAVSMGYVILGILNTFGIQRAYKDEQFTASLPLPRRAIVLSKYIVVIYSQLLHVLASVPFAIISTYVMNKGGNPVGLDANFAFYGIQILLLGVFNSIFLPGFFKTGYKMGKPAFAATTVYMVLTVIIELVIALVPALNSVLDGHGGGLTIRLTLLVVAFILYIVINYLSYLKAVKNYERVSI